MVVAQLLCVVLLAAATNGENFTWQGIARSDQSLQPPARYSAALGAFDGDLYLFGGRGNKLNGTKLLGERLQAYLLLCGYSIATTMVHIL